MRGKLCTHLVVRGHVRVRSGEHLPKSIKTCLKVLGGLRGLRWSFSLVRIIKDEG